MEKVWSFEKEFGFKPPRPLGDKVSIMPYVEKISEIIVQTDSTEENLRRETIVGRIVNMGSYAFKDDSLLRPSFIGWAKEDIPMIGDWVTFRVNSGVRYKYGPPGKGVVVMTIYDQSVMDKVEDPSYVERV